MIVTLFDTETSGLVNNRLVSLDKQPYILEFFACRCDLTTGEIGEELEFLVKPPLKELDPKITKITGLTLEKLADAKSFAEHADKVCEFLKEHPVCAHNLKFDMEMVELELERLQRKHEWPRQICTVQSTIHLKGHRLNLGALHELLFGEKFTGAHRARQDVMALARCATELYKREIVR
jgi:DNA polymerase III epsilon subunit-like protein